ncbi:uncharacterized protein B0I36DRAFT_291700 [Microdochium trichocladiopsis]|uniref:Zn(2)-C6 fungal-type domain-containing protein n=1 Tax=Microdochium trichocladiopsis TaxID=1682393 RepID=A0A9P8Y572_9PEZI|nr:uncharacterized protein B0I36DRAFT_291700 [Microdochium trichocladiopsis]KAH7029896.1 hypothetical protein B0I36DRAFT_291700 [Microdochium trichocladiopsis]
MNRPTHHERLGRRKACDLCCKKKVRCDAKIPKCSTCLLRQTDCTWTLDVVAPKVAHRAELSHQIRFSEIESRLAAIEARFHSAETGERSRWPEWAGSGPVSEQLSSLDPPGKTWIGGASFPLSQPLGGTSSAFDLPPSNQVFALVAKYFRGPNQAIPLFDQPSFMQMLQDWYQQPSTRDSASWASINVVLALSAHHDRLPGNEKLAQECLNKAQSVLNILVSREEDLKGIQVLLGLVTLFLGSPHPQPTCVLIATAVKLAHRLRLHARDSRRPANGEVSLQMDRLFWITYVLDRDICLRAVEPYAQQEDDFDVQQPGLTAPDDGAGMLKINDIRFNYFHLRVQLAQIQGLTYRMIFSVKAEKLPADQRQAAAEYIDGLLHSWQASIPAQLLPEHILAAQKEPSDAHMHLICLHLDAYHVLFTAHRIHARDSDWIHRLTTFSDRFATSTERNVTTIAHTPDSTNSSFMLFPPNWTYFVEVARLCIRLIRMIEWNNNSRFWTAICIHQTALIILIANNLTVEESNVHDQINADAQLISDAMQYSQDAMTLQSDNESVAMLAELHGACLKLHKRALKAIQRLQTRV